MRLPLIGGITAHLGAVTVLLCVVMSLVFVAGLGSIDIEGVGKVRKQEAWTLQYGAIPCEITGRCENQPGLVRLDLSVIGMADRTAVAEVPPTNRFVSLLAAQFLHGSPAHLLGNMLFLIVFGPFVERAFGAARFFVLVLMGGAAAIFIQCVATSASHKPVIGASGAVAFVLGAFLIRHPRAPVLTTLPIPVWLFELPAWVFGLQWFAVEAIQLVRQLVAPDGFTTGIATMAHLGGLTFGLLFGRTLDEEAESRLSG